MDPQSDVDYMVVFRDESLRPQTYIDRLKRFAESRYSSSEIYQSHPTVVLDLNHIRFELVPAIASYVGEFRIPAAASSYADWVTTSPNSFNSELTAANTRANYRLKPAIRLLKFWNARAGYIFESFSLEQWAAGRWFSSTSTVPDILFDCIGNLTLGYGEAQWRKDKLSRAQEIVRNTKAYESAGQPNNAEAEVKKLIPEY